MHSERGYIIDLTLIKHVTLMLSSVTKEWQGQTNVPSFETA